MPLRARNISPQKGKSMNSLTKNNYQKLVQEIGGIYEGARKAAVEAYWKIGQMIVEVEQAGALRAGYGDGLLK